MHYPPEFIVHCQCEFCGNLQADPRKFDLENVYLSESSPAISCWCQNPLPKHLFLPFAMSELPVWSD